MVEVGEVVEQKTPPSRGCVTDVQQEHGERRVMVQDGIVDVDSSLFMDPVAQVETVEVRASGVVAVNRNVEVREAGACVVSSKLLPQSPPARQLHCCCCQCSSTGSVVMPTQVTGLSVS
eukprot:2865429-Amphidinium_carterae.1